MDEELTDAERAVLRHIAHRELVMDVALIILLATSVVTVIAVIVEVL